MTNFEIWRPIIKNSRNSVIVILIPLSVLIEYDLLSKAKSPAPIIGDCTLGAGYVAELGVGFVFSAWPGVEMLNPHNLPEAHVRFRDGTTTAKPDAKLCNGNCTAGRQVVPDGSDTLWILPSFSFPLLIQTGSQSTSQGQSSSSHYCVSHDSAIQFIILAGRYCRNIS